MGLVLNERKGSFIFTKEAAFQYLSHLAGVLFQENLDEEIEKNGESTIGHLDFDIKAIDIDKNKSDISFLNHLTIKKELN